MSKNICIKKKTGSATLSKEDKSTSEEGAKPNKKKKEERLETELPHSPTPVIPGGPVEASSTGERSASDETETTPVSGDNLFNYQIIYRIKLWHYIKI